MSRGVPPLGITWTQALQAGNGRPVLPNALSAPHGSARSGCVQSIALCTEPTADLRQALGWIALPLSRSFVYGHLRAL